MERSQCLSDLLVWIESTLHSKNFLHDCFGISLFHGVILGFVHFQQFSKRNEFREYNIKSDLCDTKRSLIFRDFYFLFSLNMIYHSLH